MSRIKTITDINNMPSYAYEHKFIVANVVEAKLWFFGAYDDRNRANEVAMTLGAGIVFEVDDDNNEFRT